MEVPWKFYERASFVRLRPFAQWPGHGAGRLNPLQCVAKRQSTITLAKASSRYARMLISGIEIMHMIRKGQLGDFKAGATSTANPFYSVGF